LAIASRPAEVGTRVLLRRRPPCGEASGLQLGVHLAEHELDGLEVTDGMPELHPRGGVLDSQLQCTLGDARWPIAAMSMRAPRLEAESAILPPEPSSPMTRSSVIRPVEVDGGGVGAERMPSLSCGSE